MNVYSILFNKLPDEYKISLVKEYDELRDISYTCRNDCYLNEILLFVYKNSDIQFLTDYIWARVRVGTEDILESFIESFAKQNKIRIPKELIQEVVQNKEGCDVSFDSFISNLRNKE